MTKTFADMTEEERAACVGMWADTPGNELAVIASVSEPDVSRVFFPQSRGDGAALLNLFIAPRFDLPRAWTPDGEPELAETIAGMEWEYQCQRLLPGTPEDWYTWLTTGSLESAKRHTEKHAAKMRARGYDLPSYRIRRRLVGDWEVINERCCV